MHDPILRRSLLIRERLRFLERLEIADQIFKF